MIFEKDRRSRHSKADRKAVPAAACRRGGAAAETNYASASAVEARTALSCVPLLACPAVLHQLGDKRRVDR